MVTYFKGVILEQSEVKILIIEYEDLIREAMTFLLASTFDAHILEAKSVSEGLEILNTNNVAVVISDYVMPEGTGADIFHFVKQSGKQIQFILCSSNKPETFKEFENQKLDGYVDKSILKDPLIQVIGECLSILIQNGSIPQTVIKPPSYCRIKISTLMRMATMPCNIFLQLSKNKFLKVLNTEDIFGMEEFARFGSHDVQFLFVERASLGSFIDKLVNEILNVKVHLGAGSTEGSLRLNDQILSTVLELGAQIGMTSEIQTLAKSNVNLAIKAIRSNSELAEIMKHIVTDEENYLCSHSVALAYIACGLAVLMNWHNDSALFKLSLAAYLHDVSLYNQDLAKYRSLDELYADNKKWSTLDIEIFKHHPLKSAEIAKQFKEIPMGIDTIISQHHENSDGSGFPLGINHTRLQPLSVLFIISHDIVSAVYKNKGKIDFLDFLKQQENRYCLGYFKKVSQIMAVSAAQRIV